MRISSKSKAFTLIELLIVVAIIGILAAIAIPNFLQAQVRAKVSKGQAEMRVLAMNLETYRVDHNVYVPDPTWWYGWCPAGMACGPGITEKFPLRLLTTPVEYAASLPTDPFPNRTDWQPGEQPQYRYFSDISWKPMIQASHTSWPNTPYRFALVTTGPDQWSNVGEYLMFGPDVLESIAGIPSWGFNDGCLYDPTNGTVSWGDIVRVGP
jgi:prepilin-type N-terminal cleavage/methylation domain-containing protein